MAPWGAGPGRGRGPRQPPFHVASSLKVHAAACCGAAGRHLCPSDASSLHVSHATCRPQEVSLYPWGSRTPFTDIVNNPRIDVGHFTAMVWRASTRMGCGYYYNDAMPVKVLPGIMGGCKVVVCRWAGDTTRWCGARYKAQGAAVCMPGSGRRSRSSRY